MAQVVADAGSGSTVDQITASVTVETILVSGQEALHVADGGGQRSQRQDSSVHVIRGSVGVKVSVVVAYCMVDVTASTTMCLAFIVSVGVAGVVLCAML